MILVDFNNIANIFYSGTISEVLKEEIKLFKRSGLVEISEKQHKDIQKGFFMYALNSLKRIQDQHYKYKDVVVCVDYKRKGYWRRELQSDYKDNRDNKKQNDFEKESMKNFMTNNLALIEIFKKFGFSVIDKLETTMNNKTVTLEADEIVGVLSTKEKSLIYSNDGDYKQCVYYHDVNILNPITNKISSLTKKEIKEYMDKQLCLGQAKDNIRNIKYCTTLDKNFILYMSKTHQLEINDDMLNDFKPNNKYSKYVTEYKALRKIESDKLILEGKRKRKLYDEYFATPNFGEKTYDDLIQKISIEDILKENPLYRERYELNEKLFYFHKIPLEIKECILEAYDSLEPQQDLAFMSNFFNVFRISYKDREKWMI